MENQREIELKAWCEAVTGHPQEALQPVSGDASFRRYFRGSDGRQSVIAVDAPPAAEPLRPFVSVAEAYAEAGVCVPTVLALDEEKGFMLLRDFGSTLLLNKLDAESAPAFYQSAIDILPTIMRVQRTETGVLPAYDRALLQRELDLFHDWLLGTHLQLELSTAEQQLWYQTCEVLIANALAQPQIGVHRDYHSRNLMVLNDGSLGVIDFQDAVVGPITYDLVSLLRDCYIQWPRVQVEAWVVEAYELLRAEQLLDAEVDVSMFTRWFNRMGLQRHSKAAGIFARLCHRDGKDGYLNDIPRTLEYLYSVANTDEELQPFADWLQERVIPAWHKRHN